MGVVIFIYLLLQSLYFSKWGVGVVVLFLDIEKSMIWMGSKRA